jgi:protein-S-isoprenylcysteine O-methyltransferase Ste14
LLTSAGHFFFKVRDALFPVVLLLAGFGTRPQLAGGSVELDHWMDALGFAVALGGQAWRFLVVGLDYIARGGRNRQVWAESLVDGGMFAHSRNPLYVANVIIILGLALVHNGWVMYALVPFFMMVYAAIVSAEEEYLRGRFGDAYAEYCRRVPRWLPSLGGMLTTIRSSEFDWLKVLRKEYGTVFAWTSGLLVFLVWEHYSPSAPAITPAELYAVAAAWVVLAVAYVVTRTLKLRGRLGPP